MRDNISKIENIDSGDKKTMTNIFDWHFMDSFCTFCNIFKALSMYYIGWHLQDENWQQTSEKIAVMLCPLVQNSNRIKKFESRMRLRLNSPGT